MAHRLGCSVAREIFLDQGSNLCPLHWQVGSEPLDQQESPCVFKFSYNTINIPVSLLLLIAPFFQYSVSVYKHGFYPFSQRYWQSTYFVPVTSTDDRKMNRGPALIEGTIQLGATESERPIDCATLRGMDLSKKWKQKVRWRGRLSCCVNYSVSKLTSNLCILFPPSPFPVR